MSNVKKVVPKKVPKRIKRKSKKRRRSRPSKRVASKVKSSPKDQPKIKIKSSKGASVNKNNTAQIVGNTMQIAPSDYEHIYNAEKAKQNPEYLAKVKENVAAGGGVKLGPPSPQTAPPQPPCPPQPPPVNQVNNPLDNLPTKEIAPDDYLHIYNAKENMINGVKMPLPKDGRCEPIEIPPIEIAPIVPSKVPTGKDPNGQLMNTIDIAPKDYLHIFNKNNPPPNFEQLKKAVNERSDSQSSKKEETNE